MLGSGKVVFSRDFSSRVLDFSPRASRFVKKPLKATNSWKDRGIKNRQRFSWQKRFAVRASGDKDSWLRAYLPSEPFEGGFNATFGKQVDSAGRSVTRSLKRQLAVNNLLGSKKQAGAVTSFESLFRSSSTDTSLYLHRFGRRRAIKLSRKLKISSMKRRNRWFASRRKIRTSKSLTSPLGYFRKKINKLSGIWFLRRRRRIRRKFRLLINARSRSSQFGMWFNTTKVFTELKSLLCKKYSEYARRAITFSKKVNYRDYGSGLLRSVLTFGRLDYSNYRRGGQYFNNKNFMQPLSDYFTYAHDRVYTSTVAMYPEHEFEHLQQYKSGHLVSNDFDLTLFESRTAFWESYINTPTFKTSWLKTNFKTVASSILVAPVDYKASFSNFISQMAPWKSNQNTLRGHLNNVSLHSLRKRYFRKSWRVVLRLKFERFIFNRVKFPVYIWFHNIWGLFFKRFYRWRRFEHKVMSKFVVARRRNKFKNLKLRVNWFKMLIRSLGLLGLIVGSVHCFTYVFSFLMVKFRKHWQVLKLIKRYLRRCVRVHKTITGIRVVVSGRFTGQMRARKNIFKIGGKIRYMNYLRRLTYVLFSSQTPWGVFGIRMWIQFKPKRVRFVDDDMDKILKKSYACGGLLKRKSLLRYSRQTLVELDNCGFGLKYYTNDDIDKKRHVDDLRINYAIKGTETT